MKTEKTSFLLNSIPVNLTDDDAITIMDCVKQITPPNCYVEIGTGLGGSSVVAQHAVPEGIEVYTIDPDGDNILTDEKKADLEEIGVRYIHKTSLETVREWDKPIQVLFIDGDHSQAGMDFAAWEKYLIPGAIVLFHDYAIHSPDVIRDCANVARTRGYTILFQPTVDSTSSIFQIRKDL